MKKFLYQASMLIAILLISTACDDFGDININPNATTQVLPETILTNSLRSVSSVVGSVQGTLYSQQIAETQYTDDSRYGTINWDFNGWYTGPLQNLQHIIDLNSSEDTRDYAAQSGSNANQIAVARIMKAYYFHHVTDRWGPLPYSQALQGREDFRPAYDDQPAIYQGLFNELEAAIAQMDGGPGVKGDFILNGDMEAWKRFANTLRMVMALRIADADPALAQQQFTSAMPGAISSSAENIMYPYLASADNENPWFARFRTRTDYAISSTLVNYMKPLGDPRLEAFADPAPNYGDVRGMPYGIENAGDIPNAEISFPNSDNVKGQDTPLPIFTYSQVLFAMAEAAVRGWINDDPQTLYEEGIKASMEQWGVFDQAAFDTYIAIQGTELPLPADVDNAFTEDTEYGLKIGVAWNADHAMTLIGYQKWVAMYMQGYEAWAEWRRTRYPRLAPAPAPLNNSGEIPRRQGYPTSERDLNSDSYQAAVNNFLGGNDDLDTPMYWDKN